MSKSTKVKPYFCRASQREIAGGARRFLGETETKKRGSLPC